ncbi:hypothetical protein HK105_204195 [Polyrhizophydium stewartii]|uniref:Uncharacterized protein n=1 Tax=Polyrhizophydium stewartii TaxID=2732419 RepID=A0ABR4N9B7_9FUNG
MPSLRRTRFLALLAFAAVSLALVALAYSWATALSQGLGVPRRSPWGVGGTREPPVPISALASTPPDEAAIQPQLAAWTLPTPSPAHGESPLFFERRLHAMLITRLFPSSYVFRNPFGPRFHSFEIVYRPVGRPPVLIWTGIDGGPNSAMTRFPNELLLLAALDRALGPVFANASSAVASEAPHA